MSSQRMGASITPTYPMIETDGAGGHRPQVVLYGPDGNPLLSSAAALSDSTVNPTVPGVGSYGMAYNGTTWDRVRIDVGRNLFTVIRKADGSLVDIQRNDNDDQPNQIGLVALTQAQLWNAGGSTWVRQRSNFEAVLLASAARTASTNSADQTNQNGRVLALFLNVTGNPGGAETLTVQVQWKDPVSTGYQNLTTFPAIAAATNGSWVYLVGLGVAETVATANLEVQSVTLPRTWRATVTHSAAGSWTYSLGYFVGL